jgi:hypothetical protein
MVQLEESGDAVGVHIVGDGGSAELDGMFEDFDESGAKASEFVAGETSSLAAWADSGVEEGFVSVDIAHPMKKRLIEERSLDGGFTVTEERDEVFKRDGEGFAAGARVGIVGDGETAEAAGIDEAKLFASAEREDGVGVRWHRGLRGRDEKTTGHAEMDEELCCGRGVLASLFPRIGECEVGHDGFADSVNAIDAGFREEISNLVRRGLKGLRIIADLYPGDGLTVNALVDTIGNSFDFRKLGHDLI